MKTIREKVDVDTIKNAVSAIADELFVIFAAVVDLLLVNSAGFRIAPIAVSTPPRVFIFSIITAAAIVISRSTAFYLGKNDRENANRYFITAVAMVGVMSIVIGTASALLAGPVMWLCSGIEEIRVDAEAYFAITTGGGMLFYGMLLAGNGILRGEGRIGIALLANLIANVVNIIFDYLLIFGKCGFPALGIKGAAWATVIGIAAGAVFDTIIIWRKSGFVSIAYVVEKKIKATKECAKEIRERWRHVFVENIFVKLGILITAAITARIGAEEIAIFIVAEQPLSVSDAIGEGFEVSAVSTIGRYAGEGSIDRVKQGVRKLGIIGIITAIIIAAIIVLTASPYCSLFSAEKEFLEIGIDACYFGAAATVLLIPRMVLAGTLDGIGEEKRAERSALICNAIIQPLLCIVLVLIMKEGIEGAHYAMLITQAVWLVLNIVYYSKSVKAYKPE